MVQISIASAPAIEPCCCQRGGVCTALVLTGCTTPGVLVHTTHLRSTGCCLILRTLHRHSTQQAVRPRPTMCWTPWPACTPATATHPSFDPRFVSFPFFLASNTCATLWCAALSSGRAPARMPSSTTRCRPPRLCCRRPTHSSCHAGTQRLRLACPSHGCQCHISGRRRCPVCVLCQRRCDASALRL
jgi:hypothetical protein